MEIGFIFVIFAVVFVAIIIINVAQRNSYRRREQYQALPGALDARGEHQCNVCKNKGIYRKGQYKDSSITYCHCSKCKQLMYVEIEPSIFDKLFKP